MRKPITLLALAVTAGCGDNGTEPSPTPAAVASITLTATAESVIQGESVTVSAVLRDASANILTGRTIDWSVSSTSIATITSAGATAQVQSVAPGTVRVRATSGSASDSVTIVVQAVPVTSVEVEPDSVLVFTGQSHTFAAAAYAAGGAELTGRVITWTSSDTDIATIDDDGVATAHADGAVTITATIDGVSGTARFRARTNPVLATSYENFKESGVQPGSIPLPPSAAWGYTDVVAHAYGDFYGRGETNDLFTARIAYAVSDGEANAAQAEYVFWRRDGDSYAADNTILSPPSATCLHPRKALVADFNQDARPDVFVICHGFDADPFAGERNQILLSSDDGSYTVSYPTQDVGFFHGGSAADLNGDGYPDIVLAGASLVLINDGSGGFTSEAPGRLPALNGPYFTAELIDVDEDGDVDLLLGGHEWESAPTHILLNPGNGQFAAAPSVTIPAVANEGVIADFTVTGTGATRTVWVSRTSGGDGTFYESATLQRFDWTARTSTVPFSERPRGWVPWLLPYSRGGVDYIGSDDTRIPLEVIVP